MQIEIGKLAIRHQADIFLDASKKIVLLPIENGILEASIIPGIVLLSLSCELYLKCILNFDVEVSGRIHSLYSLFKKLPISKQNNFIKNMQSDNFQSELEDIANAFIDWRYIHEKCHQVNSINVNFLYRFCKILKINAHSADA